MALDDFVKTYELPATEMLISVSIPYNDLAAATAAAGATAAEVAAQGETLFIDSGKVMTRHVNAHAEVNGALKLSVVPSAHCSAPSGGDGGGGGGVDAGAPVVRSCTLVFGGLHAGLYWALTQHDLLEGRPLTAATVQAMMAVLIGELEGVANRAPSVAELIVQTAPSFRAHAAASLAYRLLLNAIAALVGADAVPDDCRAALGHFGEARQASRGAHEVEHSAPASEAPLGTIGVHKLEALQQAAGEALYTADLVASVVPAAAAERLLYGAPVLAMQLHRVVTSVDTSAATAVAGVRAFISAQDLKPIGAANSISNYKLFATADEPIEYVGQFVGVLLASSLEIAQRAAKLVVVSYGAKVVQACKANARAMDAEAAAAAAAGEAEEFPIVVTSPRANRAPASATGMATVATGCDGAAAQCAERALLQSVSGAISTNGAKHFYLETNVSLCVPGAGGRRLGLDGLGGGAPHLDCWTSTQGCADAQYALAQTLNRSTNSLSVSNTLCGGAYGGKHWQNYPTMAAVAVAAVRLGVPVLMQLSRNDDLLSLGGRPPVDTTFSVSYRAEGDAVAIEALDLTATADTGFNGRSLHTTCLGAYAIPGATLTPEHVATATPANGIMRAPGDFQGMIFTEAAVEAVATAAGADPVTVQAAHLSDEQTRAVWNDMQRRADYAARRTSAAAFNAGSRWRKRGLWCTPVKYVRGNKEKEMVVISLAPDGAVAVDASGIEMGQGLNTKVSQAVVCGLNKLLPTAVAPLLSMADVAIGLVKSTDQFPSASTTSGSGTSEGCVDAALKACATIVAKLAPYAAAAGPSASWASIVGAAYAAGVDLRAGTEADHLQGGSYDIYCAGCTEVELDVLTGQYEILRADLVYDAGVSLNPSLDIGQIEGSYVMATGMCLSEKQTRASDGRLLSYGTWDLKVPSVMDIPIALHVALTQTANRAPGNVLGSKSACEPGMVLGASAFFALKQCIYAARADAGLSGWVRMDLPATPEQVHGLCWSVERFEPDVQGQLGRSSRRAPLE